MTPTTPLDHAHAAMEAAPDDDTLRLSFYRALAETELFLLLESEAGEDAVEPKTFPIEGASYVLAFDREDRLAGFAGEIAPFVATSGRTLAAMLAQEGLGLGLNLDVAPSQILIPPDALEWLRATLASEATEAQETPVALFAPTGLPDALIAALDGKLAQAMGRARAAFLVGVSYQDGRKSHLLAFIDTLPGAEAALTQSVQEALVFSGIEAGILDVGFFRTDDAMTTHLARNGLRFDLPQPDDPTSPPAPGMDPDRPPILR